VGNGSLEGVQGKKWKCDSLQGEAVQSRHELENETRYATGKSSDGNRMPIGGDYSIGKGTQGKANALISRTTFKDKEKRKIN